MNFLRRLIFRRSITSNNTICNFVTRSIPQPIVPVHSVWKCSGWVCVCACACGRVGAGWLSWKRLTQKAQSRNKWAWVNLRRQRRGRRCRSQDGSYAEECLRATGWARGSCVVPHEHLTRKFFWTSQHSIFNSLGDPEPGPGEVAKNRTPRSGQRNFKTSYITAFTLQTGGRITKNRIGYLRSEFYGGIWFS